MSNWWIGTPESRQMLAKEHAKVCNAEAEWVEDNCSHPYIAENGQKRYLGGFCDDCATEAQAIRNGAA